MKPAILSVSLIAVLLGLYSYFAGRGWRRVYMFHAMNALEVARQEYLNEGRFTNYTRNWTVSASSNVVNLGGSNYHCFLRADGPEFAQKGSLHVTTNGVYVWVSSDRRMKIIDRAYKPPAFGSRY